MECLGGLFQVDVGLRDRLVHGSYLVFFALS